MRLVLALAAAALLVGGPAQAKPFELSAITTGYTYYNRPGATLEQHNAALVECARDENVPAGGSGFGPNAAPSLAFALVWSGPLAGYHASQIENCMVVRGWRVVRLPEAQGKPLAALPLDALAEALAPMVGAASPPGEVVRVWSNFAAHPGSFRITSRPPAPNKAQLSLRVLNESGVYQPDPNGPPLTPIQQVGLIKLEDIASAPPNTALLVVRVTGISLSAGTGIPFTRITQPGEDSLSAIAAVRWMSGKEEGNWFILALPPGRWRIGGFGYLNFCLGAPSLEVAAGEVVYAGTFALKGSDLGPDLDLAPAKAFLGPGPYSDRIRPANYINGSTTSCRDVAYPYSLEVDGAPFEPGYTGGSSAQR